MQTRRVFLFLAESFVFQKRVHHVLLDDHRSPFYQFSPSMAIFDLLFERTSSMLERHGCGFEDVSRHRLCLVLLKYSLKINLNVDVIILNF